MTKASIAPISLLIPTMNRPQALKRTLESYIEGSCVPSQIVVVDQSQEDSLIKEVERMLTDLGSKFRIDYIYQSTPSSTLARNAALQVATEELVVFSDDDIDIYHDTLAKICDIMEDNSIAMIAGLDDNSPQSSTNLGYLLGTKSYKNRKIGHVTYSMLGRYPDNVIGEIETQWAMGYFFVIRRSLLTSWKLSWDEAMVGYAYAEDLDFTFSYYKKAKAEGKRCILSDKVHVKHLASKEYRNSSQKSTYMYIINRAYLSYKHNMGIRSRLLMEWCNFWRLIERIIKNDKPSDIFRAICYCQKKRDEIKVGKLSYPN